MGEPIVEVEWGVLVGDSLIIRFGVGYYGQKHAEQEVERIAHNAKLPFVGQPKYGTVVCRTVTRSWSATEWAVPSRASDSGAVGE